MRTALVTTPTNGAGLERDCQSPRGLLGGADHKGSLVVDPPDGMWGVLPAAIFTRGAA